MPPEKSHAWGHGCHRTAWHGSCTCKQSRAIKECNDFEPRVAELPHYKGNTRGVLLGGASEDVYYRPIVWRAQHGRRPRATSALQALAELSAPALILHPYMHAMDKCATQAMGSPRTISNGKLVATS